MRIGSHQRPSFRRASLLPPRAMSTALVEMHELGLSIDRATPASCQPVPGGEVASVPAQVSEPFVAPCDQHIKGAMPVEGVA